MQPRSNHSTRALIVVAGARGAAMTIARSLRLRLLRHGHLAEVDDVAAMPAPDRYDAVIIGAQLGLSRDRRNIGTYVARHRDSLEQTLAGLFVVDNPEARVSRRHLEAFSGSMSWRPHFSAALENPKRDRVHSAMRDAVTAMLQRISGSNDISIRDEVGDFARMIAREVQRARSSA